MNSIVYYVLINRKKAFWVVAITAEFFVSFALVEWSNEALVDFWMVLS